MKSLHFLFSQPDKNRRNLKVAPSAIALNFLSIMSILVLSNAAQMRRVAGTCANAAATRSILKPNRSTMIPSAFLHTANLLTNFRGKSLCPIDSLRGIEHLNTVQSYSKRHRLFSAASPVERLSSAEEHQPDKDLQSTTTPNSHESSEFIPKSKPKPGGNWNQDDPIGWAKNFGRRDPSKENELFAKAQLKAGDEGYFDVSSITVPGVTMVRTVEEAKIVMEKLMSPESERVFHACDTEVMDIDLKKVGPVGNGYVTCASIYSGPDFDYGLGDGPGTALWIDNLDESFGVLQEFKEFFEDGRFQTVWHNYGFDRHVMWNEGIDVKGFGGDTMHMARLQDTSRAKYGVGTGYSLEALTSDLLGRRKKPMKELFGVARLRKDGTAGSLVDVPPVEVLQRDPRFRSQWIVYSAFDAQGTWLLRETLHGMLEEMEWVSFLQMHICQKYFNLFLLLKIGIIAT
jgi:hypothetical protein